MALFAKSSQVVWQPSSMSCHGSPRKSFWKSSSSGANFVTLKVEISCTHIRLFPNTGTAEMRHLSACVIFFSGKYSISIFCPINSMSNLSIETSTIETFPKFSSYKCFMGNSSTSSSFPFLKAMNFKQRSPKVFVSRLFGALILISPMLMERRPFRFTCRLGPWTLLTLNVSSALSATLKTRGDGGWSTAVVC